jgi:predicted phosphoadenosine phosphosulfate sulfurtransferase
MIPKLQYLTLIVSLMFDFDKEYYDKLYKFFNSNNDVVFELKDLTTEPEKFIAYVLFYQVNRKQGDMRVTLSFDQKQIRIAELFQDIIDDQIIDKFKAQAAGAAVISAEFAQPIKFAEPLPAVPPIQPIKNPFSK